MTSGRTSSQARPRTVNLWLIASALWLAFIAWRAWTGWPSVPLDMSAGDAETRVALDAAVSRHLGNAALLGLGVPAATYALLRLLGLGKKPALGSVVTRAVGAGPARVLLMRHAEKTGDPDDMHLSDAGRQRAEMLATYIPATFGRPDAIFAAAQSKRSNRSVETMQPLAAATGIALDNSYDDENFAALVERLMTDPALVGKMVVVCWHHSDLSNFARALGGTEGTFPENWDPDVFNVIVDIKFPIGGEPQAAEVVEPF